MVLIWSLAAGAIGVGPIGEATAAGEDLNLAGTGDEAAGRGGIVDPGALRGAVEEQLGDDIGVGMG